MNYPMDQESERKDGYTFTGHLDLRAVAGF